MFRHALALAVAVSTLFAVGCSKDSGPTRSDYLRSGDAYIAQKKLPEAIVQYRNAVKKDGRDSEARLKLARAYESSGDSVNAYREYIRVADIRQDDADVQTKVGELLLAAGQFDEAMAWAEKALTKRPTPVAAQILRANALVGLNKVDEAIVDVQQAIHDNPDRSATYRSLGAMQVIRGDRAEAEAAFKRAIVLDPRSTLPLISLAHFYLATSRPDDAEAQLKAALQLDPKNDPANRTLAFVYMTSGRTAEAEPLFKMLAATSADGSGRLLLANYYLGATRAPEGKALLEQMASEDSTSARLAKVRLASLVTTADEAGRLIDQVLQKDPHQVEALVARAELRLKAGRLDEALASATAATDADPRSALAHYALGKVQKARRSPQEAIASFNKALQANPRLAGADLELADLYLAAGQAKEAEQSAQSADIKLSGSPDAQLALARSYLAQGNAAKARPVVAALLEAFPDSAAVQTEAGTMALANKNGADARASFERALARDRDYLPAIAALTRLDLDEQHPAAAKARVEAAIARSPRNVALQVLSGTVYMSLQDIGNAERVLRVAIDLDPNGFDAFAMLAGLYAQQRQIPKAIAQMEDVIKRQPKNVGAHTMIGILNQMQNRPENARTYYERAIDLDSQAAVAANNLAWIYAEEGNNLEVALRLAQTAKAELPDQPAVSDTLAWVYQKMGIGPMAVTSALETLKKDPTNATFHYHLGVAYSVNREPEKAREALERALKMDAKSPNAAQIRELLASL